MQVEQREYQLLNEALVDAYGLQSMDMMLQFGLGKKMSNIVASAPFEYMVFNLIGHYNRRDQVEMLVQAARRFNPTNGKLHEVAQSLGKVTKVNARLGNEPSALVEGMGLETWVKRQVPMLNSAEMRKHMMRVEGQMCIIEQKISGGKGKARGSGFLIGPKTVLTNYHVVRNFLQGTQAQNLQVRFDALLKENRVREPGEGSIFDVDKIPIYSPYTKGDARNLNGPPEDDELDFAILELSDEAGNSRIGGNAGLGQEDTPREWMQMSSPDPVFEENGPLIIYQYPGGRELLMAIDTEAIVGTEWEGRRLRYRNNTEPGSSGSPIFDIEWKLVALHHGGWPSEEELKEIRNASEPVPDGFNQGIPVNLINDYVESKGLGELFGE